MKIAYLAWGSLVWNTGELKIKGEWMYDGPSLPIEFARKSEGNRLTLVIYPQAKKVRTFWAYSAKKSLEASICQLAKREGTTTGNIGFVSVPDDDCRCVTSPDILPIIRSWAKQKGIDVVIWTDLRSNFEDLTAKTAIEYLERLDASSFKDAETYVRMTPQQIRTEIRASLEAKFGWSFVSDMEECDWTDIKRDFMDRTIHRARDDSFWAVVPDKPAAFGHTLVISWRGIQSQDITDKGLHRDANHISRMMRLIHNLAFVMRSSLTSDGEADGLKCKKVYLVSECETNGLPFHFHLIPRYEDENTGHLHLLARELEEARWRKEDEEAADNVQDGLDRIAKVRTLVDSHDKLLGTSKWGRSNNERKEAVASIVDWWNEQWSFKNPNTGKHACRPSFF